MRRLAAEKKPEGSLSTREGQGRREELGQAWALVDRGICSKDPAERVKLAHEALTIREDCSGAYLLLAEGNLHSDPAEAVFLCERAIETAQASMGFSLELVKHAAPGDLFHMPASKRYVEAVAALSHSLRAADRRSEAITRAFEVLELDTADHLGISHSLIEWLMEYGLDNDAIEVLKLLPCPCAHHAYSRALLTFRAYGERDRRAAWALKLALENNGQVPAHLLGKSEVPPGVEQASADQPRQPDMEAARYASKSAGLWASTPGALEWLGMFSSDADLLEDTISPTARRRSPGVFTGQEPTGAS